MSFGCSIGDGISLTQLAWKVVQNTKAACGEHDELTREVSNFHVVLKRLEHEVTKSESPINRPGDTCREEIEAIIGGCQRVLKILDQILKKYNALSETERSGRKLWQKIKFGNGRMADLAEFRTKIVYYTSTLSLLLNMISIGTMGSVEKQMDEAGGDLKEIKQAVNGITAHLIAKGHSEGSVLTAYPDDDKAIWKELRRELIEDGFSSAIIQQHKVLIKAYVKELGARGLLDDAEPQAVDEQSAHPLFCLEETATLPALMDPSTADRQGSPMLVAEKTGPYVQISPETTPNPLLMSEVQSDTQFAPDPDLRSDIDSKPELIEKGKIDIKSVTSICAPKADSVLTTDIENSQHLHPREISCAELINANHSTTFSYAGAQSSCTEKATEHSEKGLKTLTPISRVASTEAEAVVRAIDKDYESPQEIGEPDSPAELIKVVSNAWYDEYLATSQYFNIVPSLSAKKALLSLLPKLDAVDLEAIGWTTELKACRTTLIKQIKIRVHILERRSQTMRKHHICRPRCFCKSNAPDNVKSMKDPQKLFETSTDLTGEILDGPPLKSTPSRFGTVRRDEVQQVLSRIWHDHHDRVAPLCLEWADLWGRRVWEQGRFQKLLSINAKCMKLIIGMRDNKQEVEKLNIDGDVHLTARRQELLEDIKMMVSSLRIFKTDNRWKWQRAGALGKGIGERVCLDISWARCTIVSRLGAKYRVCSAT